MSKELEKIVRQAVVTEQHVDKLVQVYRLTGQPTWVLIHIDVQSQHETQFAKRMFQYHYRLFDRYDRPVVTLVIYGDEGLAWRPQEYEEALWLCRVKFEFPTVKLAHYQIADLEQSANPFALVVLAHLHTKATKHDPTARYHLKWRLTRLLYERGYNRAQILSLFRYIDWLMALPLALEQQLDQNIEQYEEAQKMSYITSIERLGYQRGLSQGIEQGISQGISQGLQQGISQGLQQGISQGLQTLRETILEVLQLRFSDISPQWEGDLKLLTDLTLLKQLHRQAIITTSLAAFETELTAIVTVAKEKADRESAETETKG